MSKTHVEEIGQSLVNTIVGVSYGEIAMGLILLAVVLLLIVSGFYLRQRKLLNFKALWQILNKPLPKLKLKVFKQKAEPANEKIDNIQNYVELIALSMTNMQRRLTYMDDVLLKMDTTHPNTKPTNFLVMQKRVVELSNQGQDVATISRNCKIPQNEVEIILALRSAVK